MPKSFLIQVCSILLLLFICTGAAAQENDIKPAPEFPTKEIYNLLVDRHGFLWIASDFGVSRFDGINYTHFSHPRQISLGCTNLLEDNYGRIWFTNFNGQIFYIEHETVTLINSYNYKKERNFPRMALFHDQLLATSDKGMFVLNTQNLSAKYIGSGNYTTSLAVLKDRVLVRGDKVWYSYTEATGLKKITYSGDSETGPNLYVLAKNTLHDTAYLMVNPTGAVRKLLLKNDTVKQCGQLAFNRIINTVSITPEGQWVNTNDFSYSLKNGEKINRLNLSDIVTDQEGSEWYSSLYHGLMVKYKKDIANKTTVPGLDTGDLIISVRNHNNKLLLGSQKGFLMLYDPVLKTVSLKLKVSPAAGSIYYIAPIGGEEFVVAASSATYRVDIATKKITELPDITTIKQACYDDKAIYISSASGLYVLPREKSEQLKKRINEAFGHVLKYDAANDYFSIKFRSRTIAYFPDQSALFVSFKNSLFKIDKNGMKPFLYNGDQVYAGALAYLDHRLYIGTISNGMLIVENNDIKHISVQNGLFSKSIFKIKPVDKNLWILGSGPLQTFNTQKNAPVNDYEFPDRSASEVLDIDGLGKTVYMATPSGFDNFPLAKTTADKKLRNYLLYVKVNNQTLTDSNGHHFSYSENNVLFNIGVPAYAKAREIYIKYCLVTKTDSTWQTTEPGERTIHFSSLMPGTYILKAIAIDPRLGMADRMIQYEFKIDAPWWGSTGFKIVLVALFLLFLFFGYVSMLRKRLSLKKTFDTQQQLILAERQRISSEMHDDIGSGAFAIQWLADKASKRENPSPEIEQIKEMVGDLSVKIRDVIWSTNVGNDNLENLLYYTYYQINKLFEHSEINFVSELPDDVPELQITVQSRRNIYLLVKEVVHNAIKHSKASTIELKMSTDDQVLSFAIIDNGVGIDFNSTREAGSGMGLGNMKSRVEKLNGELSIENNHGAQIRIKIPFSALGVVEFDKTLSKWQLFIAGILKLPSDQK